MELAACLRDFSPESRLEEAFLSRMLELAERPGACDRHAFAPGHFTASALVLDTSHRNLLLIHHKKLRAWLQPGGHIEPTDTDLHGAALRELQEEVGLSALSSPLGAVPFDLDVHTIPANPKEPAHEHFDVRFLFVSRPAAFVQNSEVLGARWVELDRVADVSGDASVVRVLTKIERYAGRALARPNTGGGVSELK